MGKGSSYTSENPFELISWKFKKFLRFITQKGAISSRTRMPNNQRRISMESFHWASLLSYEIGSKGRSIY